MQSFQLVRGLYDTDIQEKNLSEAANRDLTLADITKLAEAIESGGEMVFSPRQGA